MPFQPGKSGNPGGRPKDKFGVRELARKLAPEAIKTLRAIMEDRYAPHNARVAAACHLLDRGYGRPEQHSTVDVIKRDATDWSRDELVAFLDDSKARGSGIAAEEGCYSESDSVH